MNKPKFRTHSVLICCHKQTKKQKEGDKPDQFSEAANTSTLSYCVHLSASKRVWTSACWKSWSTTTNVDDYNRLPLRQVGKRRSLHLHTNQDGIHNLAEDGRDDFSSTSWHWHTPLLLFQIKHLVQHQILFLEQHATEYGIHHQPFSHPDRRAPTIISPMRCAENKQSRTGKTQRKVSHSLFN